MAVVQLRPSTGLTEDKWLRVRQSRAKIYFHGNGVPSSHAMQGQDLWQKCDEFYKHFKRGKLLKMQIKSWKSS